jgi:hypothetical protein
MYLVRFTQACPGCEATVSKVDGCDQLNCEFPRAFMWRLLTVFVQVIMVKNLRGRRVMFIEEIWGENASQRLLPAGCCEVGKGRAFGSQFE